MHKHRRKKGSENEGKAMKAIHETQTV